MKVLVVDPDLRRAPALEKTLTAGGAEVTVAPSGSFALTMLEWNRHDVVVSRARIEDMDGHELCAILKSDPGTRNVRFVLVAAADEVTAAETAAAGVDLVLPPGMMSGALLPLVVRLVEANRATAGERAPARAASRTAPPTEVAPPPPSPPLLKGPGGSVAPLTPLTREAAPVTPTQPVPRIRPDPLPPPTAEPPKRYATAATAGPEGPWGKATTPAPGRGPASPMAPRPGPTPASRPGSAPASRSGPPARPPAAPPAQLPAMPPVPDLSSMPSGTFQGSLEVLEFADLTQAIGAGGKTGRLILALPQGNGLMLFEKGRVVHAEFRNAVGEEAFGALLAACQADGAGRFCFLPSPPGETTGLPRTIAKTVDQLLLSSATAIDEKG
jgi:CheY-like chemotaxis protein